jgi:hypothetical protein
MATFANQASNLSALASKFDRLLEVRNAGEDSRGYPRSKGANAEELPTNVFRSLMQSF